MVSLEIRGPWGGRNRPNNLIKELVGVSQTLLVTFLESALKPSSGQARADSDCLRDSQFLRNTGPRVRNIRISPGPFGRWAQVAHRNRLVIIIRTEQTDFCLGTFRLDSLQIG